MKLIHALICVAACTSALAAGPQWQWLDKDGRKVFSDRPPPADVPDQNILKRPGRGATPPVAAPSPALANAPGTAGVDKSLQDKRKQAEDADAAKRKADEERTARVMAENCARAQQAKANFDSGSRISRVNERGEREFLDEAALASESQRIQASINENCR